MQRNGETICNRYHTTIAPKDPGKLNYGKTDYHSSCYLKYIREKGLQLRIPA